MFIILKAFFLFQHLQHFLITTYQSCSRSVESASSCLLGHPTSLTGDQPDWVCGMRDGRIKEVVMGYVNIQRYNLSSWR